MRRVERLLAFHMPNSREATADKIPVTVFPKAPLVSVDGDSDFLSVRAAAERISRTRQMADLLDESVSAISAITKCDACVVYLLEREVFVLQASRLGQGAVPRVSKKAVRTVASISKPGDAIWIPETAFRDPRHRLFTTSLAPSFEAVLLIPIAIRGQLAGLINSYGQLRHQFARREIKLASVLSSILGLQIDLLRLRKQNASLTERLASCDEIEKATRVLQSELNFSQEDAYLLLQRRSRETRAPMRDVAAAILVANNLKHASNSDHSSRGIPTGNPESLS